MLEVTDTHKKEIERQILHKIIAELEANTMETSELPKIGEFVLSTINTVTNHEELLPYLAELSAKWACFKPIENIELGEVQRVKEHEVAHQVLLLSKNGKIDEALSLAKSMTQR
jgi:hypothetical protein